MKIAQGAAKDEKDMAEEMAEGDSSGWRPKQQEQQDIRTLVQVATEHCRRKNNIQNKYIKYKLL